MDSRIKDGVQGTHGGTLVRGEDYVEVEVKKDGHVLAAVRVDCICPEQARAVHQLADLWAASQSEPEFFAANVQRCLDTYSIKDGALGVAS